MPDIRPMRDRAGEVPRFPNVVAGGNHVNPARHLRDIGVAERPQLQAAVKPRAGKQPGAGWNRNRSAVLKIVTPNAGRCLPGVHGADCRGRGREGKRA
jgi:hypothetical protein